MFDPIAILSFVVLLGVLILVHEWGHFIVAKSFGVRVDVFSIGFGPRIWGWKRGATDYRLSVLPLGGYVKMAGDNPMEERAGAPDEFLSKPRWQRAAIAVAGPAMNIVLAVLLMTGLNYFGIAQPRFLDQPAVIAAVGKGSEAERAGIQGGDRVVAINGVQNPVWEQVFWELVLTVPGREVPITLERNGETVNVTVRVPADPTGDLPIGYAAEDIVVGRLMEGSPAEAAGLRPGDKVVSINGKNILNRQQFLEQLQESGGKPVRFVLRRDNTELETDITPSWNESGGRRWTIGMYFGDITEVKSYPLGESFARALWINLRFSRQIFGVVVELFRGGVSIKTLGGPLEIARQSGAAAKQGLQDFVRLMALISINLAILNLLPIPILDGGHLLLLSVEGVIRRDLSLAVKERFVQVGLVFLLVVFAVVMYNDILKSFR